MIKQQLKQAIKEALTDLGIEISDFGLEYPSDFAHGDLSSNVAMVHAKISKQNPRALAEKIVEKLEEQKKTKKLDNVERLEIAGPGFINFYLSRDFFVKNVQQILKQDKNFGKNGIYAGKKVMVEYTDPNPFKPFHIGHLMANAIGESISRLVENGGAEVKRATYGGDLGMHVAKAMWGMLKNEYKNDEDPILYIGRSYVEGNEAFEDDPVLAQSIKDINKKIFEKSDPQINKLYEWGKEISLEHFHQIYKKLGTNFDFEFFESEMVPIGMKIVEEFVAKNVFEKSEGAVVFKGEQYGLHTRVFVNSQGLPTYETKELGLTKRKMELYPFDLSIVVTANEQNDYFKVLLKVIELVFPDISSKMRHISHGILRFADGKMSSRKGNIITGESLIHTVQNLVADKISDRELSDREKKNILDTVAIGAIKFSILKQSPGSDIIFDMEKSLSFEGDSGPYLQYSAVRGQSIIQKAQKEGINVFTEAAKDLSEKNENENSEAFFELEKLISRFEDIVEHATIELAPQQIVTYLLQLASAFNSYYANNKIVDIEDKGSSYKVALTQIFVYIMNTGLNLLGISAPEKM